MKKIKQIQANGFYIFHGEVAANSNFIETNEEAKRFLVYANFFLKDYLTVYEYLITRHEWHIVVKLKSREEFSSFSGFCEETQDGENLVWRIVSERVRLFLSNYVRCVNRMRGRTGTLVHSSYKRYYFESLLKAKEIIEALREQTWRFYRRKKKYQGLKKHYKIPKKFGNGSIFLCSKEVQRELNKGRNFLESQSVSQLTDLVLSNLVHFTKTTHKLAQKPIISTNTLIIHPNSP